MNLSLSQPWAYVFVILGASCWGMTGMFVQELYEYGLTPWQVVTLRLTTASLILLGLLGLFHPAKLKVHVRDLPHLFLLGIISIAFFNFFYFIVIERTTIAIAVVFIYTSPIFASLIARVLFGETLTFRKGIAILLIIIGCALAIGLIPGGNAKIGIVTILIGLLSGLFCASYSLIGKTLAGKYHPFTTTFYALVGGTLVSLPTSGIHEQMSTFMIPAFWLSALGLSVVSTILGYILFTIGLYFVESSKAVILSSVELVVSVLISVLVLREALTIWQGLGVIMIIFAISLTVISFQRRVKKAYPDMEISWQ